MVSQMKKLPFDPSLMVYFRKRLTPEVLGEINEMIVDATCAPSNIRYPQDVSLLNEARENAETLLDVLHDPRRL